MNDQRRKALRKAAILMDEAMSIILECASDERDYYDNMPEALQSTDKGDRASEVVDELDTIGDELSDLITRVSDAEQ